jgi:crotonobetainyl-CoA:carnitine CoA-transferase CaiB-like acyl-CoA transferase
MGLNALQGVRVLDLSHVIAGPTASHYLALEGAEVIKIEKTGKGDILRRSGQALAPGISVGFAAINLGKKSLALDLKTPEGKDVLRQLIPTADVFIENFRPGAVARLGFDYEAVRALNPKIIYASISGFGQEGAWSSRAAYDHVVQSAIGMSMMQGEQGQEPMKVGFPVVDTATGMMGAQAILTALLRRFRQDQGAFLDVSMAQAGLQLMWPDASRAAQGAGDAPRIGNRGFSGSPGAATFQCADGWISTAANTLGQFTALCKVLDVSDVPQNPELIDQVALQNGGFLVAKDAGRIHSLLAGAIKTRRVEELEKTLMEHQVPCAKLRPLSELVTRCQSEDLMTLPVRRTHYPLGVMTDFGSGYKSDHSPEPDLPSAPRLGQHSREILAGLGMAQAAIDALIQSGAVADGA